MNTSDIARLTGMSRSTVDRVLNERGSVSEATRKKIITAARELGLRRVLPDLWHGTYRIELIIPKNGLHNHSPLWGEIDAFAQIHARNLPSYISLHRTLIPEGDHDGLYKAILTPPFQRNALIIAAGSDEAAIPALLEVSKRGEQIVTIVNDVPIDVDHLYGGVDNFVQGQTAGQLMNGLLRDQGEILIIQGSSKRREHRDRVVGFLKIIDQHYPVLVHETNEDDDITSSIVLETFNKHHIVGIYSTVHAPDAIGDILKKMPDRPKWISHELSDKHKLLLQQDVIDFVLDQDADTQVAWAIANAAASILSGNHGMHLKQPEFKIFCKTNI
ncbi:LacI family DNA-binding transcriptional regulator [uncultured Bartonella sp.]|uniref:LacI family DNA-binding transcriptional regulator n=1 Tax=uncultured Bartonella sp. TaxID=104108 RepID=UPI0025E24E53|nr:LacI family DNA-binding transcriptional regulator [uncultured Bartonella sp.]